MHLTKRMILVDKYWVLRQGDGNLFSYTHVEKTMKEMMWNINNWRVSVRDSGVYIKNLFSEMFHN